MCPENSIFLSFDNPFNLTSYSWYSFDFRANEFLYLEIWVKHVFNQSCFSEDFQRLSQEFEFLLYFEVLWKAYNNSRSSYTEPLLVFLYVFEKGNSRIDRHVVSVNDYVAMFELQSVLEEPQSSSFIFLTENRHGLVLVQTRGNNHRILGFEKPLEPFLSFEFYK